MTDIEQTVALWAERHREIVSVELGGSRAKGTHLPHSDYDFGIGLDVQPTIRLVEHLVQEFPLPKAKIWEFSRSNRHFVIIGAQFLLKAEGKDIEVTLAFTDLTELEHAFDEGGNYVLLDEKFEFLKSSRIVYDPHSRIAALKGLAYPGWVRKRIIEDCIGLAAWNLDKYRKALSKRSLFAAELGKTECLWLLVKTVATMNHVSVGHRYEYEQIKERILDLKDSLYPADFFGAIERCAYEHDPDGIQRLLDEVIAIRNRIG